MDLQPRTFTVSGLSTGCIEVKYLRSP